MTSGKILSAYPRTEENHGVMIQMEKADLLGFFLYTILLLGFISTQCLIDMIPITV
jgi:hypothetical protein